MEFLEGEEARLIKLNNEELLDEFERIVNNQIFIHKTLNSREKEGKVNRGDIDRYKNIWINFQIKLLEILKD